MHLLGDTTVVEPARVAAGGMRLAAFAPLP
jgi:hypothetical protein